MKLSQSAIGGYSIAANNCSDTLKFVPTAGQMSGSTNAAGGVLTELSGEYADNGIVSLSRNGVDRKYFSVDDSSGTPLAELPDAPAVIQVAGDYNLLAPAEPLGIEMPMFEEVAADMPEFELPCCNDMDLAFEETGTMSGTAPVDVSGSGSALFEAVTAVDTLTAGLYPATLLGDDGSKSKYAIELGIC